jgi:septal ring factor EnvC (AmiA/AmiB activator)
MSGRFFMVVFMFCPMMTCFAGSSTRTLKETWKETCSVYRVTVDNSREPERRFLKKSASRRRLARRGKRYVSARRLKVGRSEKFSIPGNHAMAGIHITGNFEKDRGRLPWPVSSGTVTMRFGLQEVSRGLRYNSLGITVECSPGLPVMSISDGYVQSIFNVDDNPVVMIRHGKYFTTYSNLTSVSVCKNEPVRAGQILGSVADNGKIDFIISDKMDRCYDPEKWLRK